MQRLTIDRKWRCLLSWLRRSFPPHKPIRVQSVPAKRLGKMLGVCTFDAKHGKIGRFTISVNRQMSFALRTDVVIHEWAHALTWFGSPNLDDHSEEWGCAYSRIYRAFCEWNYGREATLEEDDD